MNLTLSSNCLLPSFTSISKWVSVAFTPAWGSHNWRTLLLEGPVERKPHLYIIDKLCGTLDVKALSQNPHDQKLICQTGQRLCLERLLFIKAGWVKWEYHFRTLIVFLTWIYFFIFKRLAFVLEAKKNRSGRERLLGRDNACQARLQTKFQMGVWNR